MRAMTVYVDVRDLTKEGVSSRRVAGVIDGGERIAVAAIKDGDRTTTPELEFPFADALLLAEACLSGDRRALTTPGLARYLSATVAVLFRVSIAAGALQRQGDLDGGDAGYLDDRAETDPDEDPD